MTSRRGSTSDRTACMTMIPTNVTATPTTATSEAPVGRWTGRQRSRGSGAALVGRHRLRSDVVCVPSCSHHGRSMTPSADADHVLTDGRHDAASGPCQRAGARCDHAPPGGRRTRDTATPADVVVPIGAGLAVARRSAWSSSATAHGARASRRRVPRRQRPARAGCTRSSGRSSSSAPSCSDRSWRSSRSSCAGTASPSAALLVTVLKLVSERAVKAVVSRERPGTSIGPDIELRGDVHVTGESFVSGHAVLVAGLAGVVTPVPARAAGRSCRGCSSLR